MDIEWGEHSKKGIDEKNIPRETVEYVIRNSPYIYDMDHEKYLTKPEKEKRFLVVGLSKEGEFSQKPMTVYFGIDGGKIKPYSAGPSTERHLERFREQRGLLKDNPLREPKEPLKVPQHTVQRRDSAMNKLYEKNPNFVKSEKKIDREKVVQAVREAQEKSANQSTKSRQKQKTREKEKDRERDV